MPKRPIPWLGLLLGLLAAACSSPTTPTSSLVPRASIRESAVPTATLEQVSDSFDIGDGRDLYLTCTGAGSPTILLEAGDTDTGRDHWRFVMPELIPETRTCTYDRAGLGLSSPAAGCRQLDDLLNDLDALLAAADLEGPYVLVGASGGGFIMAGFAARHPDQVSGMVFVETPKALTAELYPAIVPEIACDAPGNVEHRDYLAVEHAAWDHRAKLGDFPLVVMTYDWGDLAAPNTDEATNVDDQRGWFALSPDNARQVVVTTGHYIAGNQPGLVVREIRGVLEAARAQQAP